MIDKYVLPLLVTATAGPALAHPGDHAPMSPESHLAHLAASPIHLAAPLGAVTLIALFFGVRTLARQWAGRRGD